MGQQDTEVKGKKADPKLRKTAAALCQRNPNPETPGEDAPCEECEYCKAITASVGKRTGLERIERALGKFRNNTISDINFVAGPDAGACLLEEAWTNWRILNRPEPTRETERGEAGMERRENIRSTAAGQILRDLEKQRTISLTQVPEGTNLLFDPFNQANSQAFWVLTIRILANMVCLEEDERKFIALAISCMTEAKLLLSPPETKPAKDEQEWRRKNLRDWNSTRRGVESSVEDAVVASLTEELAEKTGGEYWEPVREDSPGELSREKDIREQRAPSWDP